MYKESIIYALNGIANTVHKSFCQPSGPNQGYQQLAQGPC